LANSLITELKRRNVIKVCIAYLVLAWVIIQVTQAAVPALHLPEWINTAVFFFGLIGFPFVIFASWVFEITPDGVKKESDIAPENSVASHTGRKLDFFIIFLLVVGLGYFIYESRFDDTRQLTTNSSDVKTPIKLAPSIAVLPFEDMSGESDQEYFGDGIAEELLNVLAKTEGLRVAARTSSFKFKGNIADITEIGKALNVKTILEGSIRKSGNQIRVTAQLINVEDGYHLWSETYDRELKNIFKVQDEISQAIVDKLKLKLDLKQSHSKETNIEAYELYLKGRKSAREPQKDTLLIALDYYQQAIAIDPNYAKAYAGIASAWIWLEDYGGFSATEAFPLIEKNARTALTLDSSEAEALMAMGLIYKRIYDDALAARFFFEQAIKINPSHVEIYTHFADVLLTLDQYEESIKQRKKAVELDPLSTFYRGRLINAQIFRNKLPEAKEGLDELFAIDPNDDYGLEELANLFFLEGKIAEAIPTLIRVHNMRPGDAFSAAKISYSYQLLGDNERTTSWLGKSRERGVDNRWELNAKVRISLIRADWQLLLETALLKESDDKDISASWAGFAHLNMGAKEKALENFNKAIYTSNSTSNINADIHYAMQGMARLKRNSAEAIKYQQLAEQLYHKLLKIGHPEFGNPGYNAYFGLACLKLNLLSNSSGKDQARNETLKREAIELLNKAIDSGFREATFLKSNLFFEAVREDKNFLAVESSILALNAIELEKLQAEE
jgi:TolB-like protein/Tfp pilus assembly protein PilF